MKLQRNIKLLIFLLLFFFLFRRTTLAATANSFVTIVNPVRGEEGVKFEKNLTDHFGLAVTWLLRFDAFESEQAISYFRNFKENQELGLFLEITPGLAKQAEVVYPQGGVFWHDANKIFLSGYKPEDRVKLIDVAFGKFQEIFGYYPRSVGAWHVDASSAEYMRKKYGVTGVLICADQFGTDGYQIWGGWWGVPYYPSRFNILMPAQTPKNKIDTVVFWWAARDPDLGYGGSVNESTYSVQVNDYLSHGLEITYFKALLDVYLSDERNLFGQVTVGLENDSNWEKIGSGFGLQIEEIAGRQKAGAVNVVTMEEFSEWYRNKFIALSPDHKVGDWYLSSSSRVGLIEKEGKKYLRDLRIYNEEWPEANLLTANPWETLSLNNPYKIDTVKFGNSAIKVDFEISDKEVVKRFGKQEIPFRQNSFLLLLFYSFTLLLLICFLRKNLPFLFLVTVGSTSLSLAMVKSGLVYPFGMGFWGPNGHDGIWHIALINQLAKFSLDNPVFSGARLINYHFGFDLLAAALSRLTGIVPVNLYFQILPPVMAILIGVLTYNFVRKWTASKSTAWWATFFVYFGGSWGWLVSLLKVGRLGGESTFWANQAVSSLINPPYALSLIVLLLGLIKFLDYCQSPNKKNLIFCAFLFGILIQVKVYAGIVVLGSLFCLSAFTLRRMFGKLFGLSLLLALAVFMPFNLTSSSFLVFSPLWFPRSMLAYADRLGWFKLENARIAYLNSGKWLKWLLAEGLALTIFIFGNLGTRLLGFFYGGLLARAKKKISEIEIFLFGILLISLVIPLLFIQKGNPWNTIQFFYYFQFFMAILSGVVVGKWWKKAGFSRVQHIFIYVTSTAIVLLTLMTSVTTLKNDYLPGRPPARIGIEELEALQFLAQQPNGAVLTFPYNPEWRSKFSEPRPLYAYETTAYVSALGNKISFMADEMNLEISGYDWQKRREEQTRFFMTADQEWANKFLTGNKIKYIYLVKGQKMNLGLGDINAQKIFENGEVTIHRVNNVK